jgi:formylglycine-generating enzyme required for sulfatase activity
VVESGESVKLVVVANSLAEPTYQWYRGSSGETSDLIVGATGASYTTPALTTSASYWVRVSNACGQANSLAAVVTVAPLGPIIVYLGPGNTVPLVLMRIVGGVPFMMGAPAGERASHSYEQPQHLVTIAQDYYLGKFEVTQAQWQAVMGSNPATGYGVGPDYPVYYVSWSDIAAAGGFIEKLNQHLTTTGEAGAGKFRLPTEAEWEYAARAGTTERFSHGDVLECSDYCESCATHAQYMWWCANSGAVTHQKGEKLANLWGLFDMHGNVWEWVQDWWHETYTGAPTDGNAWVVPSGSNRVIRGGSWDVDTGDCRSARRADGNPDDRNLDIGFRLARSQ